MQVSSSRRIAADVDDVWAALVDATRHTAWIPLTRVETDGRPRAGTRVVAVSGPGARRSGRGFVDRMRITRFEPPVLHGPGVAVFTKVGPTLVGSSTVEVRPDGDGASVRWSEDVHLAGPLPASVTGVLLAAPLAAMLRLALGRAARELGRRRP